jgi:hypothetical protein
MIFNISNIEIKTKVRKHFYFITSVIFEAFKDELFQVKLFLKIKIN